MWVRLIGNTAALVLAMYLATSQGVLTWLIALVIVAGVAISNSRVTRPQTSMS